MAGGRKRRPPKSGKSGPMSYPLTPGERQHRSYGRERALSVRKAWNAAGGSPREIPTPHGTVRLRRVEFVEEVPGRPAHVEVWVGDPAGGDPHFVIFNPPRLASDPRGDIVRGDAPGARVPHRYRDDPLAAIAEVIAANGGAGRGGVRR